MYPLSTLFTPLRGSHLYLVFTADLLSFPLVELEDATEESCTGDDGGGGSPGQHQPHYTRLLLSHPHYNVTVIVKTPLLHSAEASLTLLFSNTSLSPTQKIPRQATPSFQRS